MEYDYDLAISLLDEDSQVGWDIVNNLGNLDKIFFYKKDVDKLTFNNGVNVFGDIFSSKARFILVLHREQYGQTDWTALENSIIQERFIKTVKENNSPILFCKLDKSPKPNWLPDTYIYGSISPLENLIKILRKKITDFGGVSYPQTAEERLKLIIDKNNYEKAFKQKVLICQELADTAREEALILRNKLFKKLKRNAEELELYFKDSTKSIYSDFPIAVFNLYFHNLNIYLKDYQYSPNSIEEAYLEILIRKEEKILISYKKKFYITINKINGWRNIDESVFLSTDSLIEKIFQDIVTIISGKNNQPFVI